jgi:hypothetical protein
MLSAARYFSPGPGAAASRAATLLYAEHHRQLPRLRRNCMWRFISSRPQVVPKKNRSATIRTLNVVGVTPVSAM